MLTSFEGSLKILQELSEKNQRRVDKLEHVCTKQEKEHTARIAELEDQYIVTNIYNADSAILNLILMMTLYRRHLIGIRNWRTGSHMSPQRWYTWGTSWRVQTTG